MVHRTKCGATDWVDNLIQTHAWNAQKQYFEAISAHKPTDPTYLKTIAHRQSMRARACIPC